MIDISYLTKELGCYLNSGRYTPYEDIPIKRDELTLIISALKAAEARWVLNNYHPSVTTNSYEEVSVEAAQAETSYAALRQGEVKNE